jgi:hypothetical protein
MRKQLVILARVACIAAVASMVCAAAEGPPTSTSLKGETSVQAIRRASKIGALEAEGTWWTEDGQYTGIWRLCDGFEITEAGDWKGAMLITQFDAGVKSDVDQPQGNDEQVVVTGSLGIGRMTVSAALRMTMTVSAAPRMTMKGAEDSSSTGPVFPGTAKAILSGVRIDGEFASDEGVVGRWDGWWHAWGRPEGVAVTPVDESPNETTSVGESQLDQ